MPTQSFVACALLQVSQGKEGARISKDQLVINMKTFYTSHSPQVLVLFLMILTCWSRAKKAPFDDDFSNGIGSKCLQQLFNTVYEDDEEALTFTLQSLAEEGQSCNINEIIPDKSGQTLLMYAVLHGKSPELVTTLLDNGADVSIGEIMGYTPIHGAAFQGRCQLVSVLLNHPKAKVDVNDRHNDGYTPLMRACWGKEERHAETVRALLENGANPDEPQCARTQGEEKCIHLIESTQSKMTVKVLKNYTKIDKYKATLASAQTVEGDEEL